MKQLYELVPERFRSDKEKVFARWVSDLLIADIQATRILKTAVTMNGMNPDLYALHSLRSGGATALYRATGDLDLVARYGRWKSSSIHSYLWESHQMLLGIAELMASEGGPIVHSAAGRPKQNFKSSPSGGFGGGY